MIDRPAIVAAALALIGTPFQHQAAVPGVGCDCVGVLVCVARACKLAGADVFATTQFRGYAMTPDPSKLLAACERYLDPLVIGEAQPGDVLVMRVAGEPRHFGILTARGPRMMVHSYVRGRGVREVRVDPYWGGLVMRAYAFRAA